MREAIKLGGLDGSNLFGFLASYGLLRLLDAEAVLAGAVRPRLYFGADFNAMLVGVESMEHAAKLALVGLGRLNERLKSTFSTIAKPNDLTQAFVDLVFQQGDIRDLEELAGLGCCIDGEAHESTLCAANGAGHQNLVLSMRDILALVARYPSSVSAAMARTWPLSFEPSIADRKDLYLKNRKPTLRLDPSDERLYALRADNPTSGAATYRTELGAQALAAAAFGGLPLAPLASHPLTVGSARHGPRTYFYWGLWEGAASYPSVRSLLACGGYDRAAMSRRGVFAAFRAARITGAKGKLSFAPTEPWW